MKATLSDNTWTIICPGPSIKKFNQENPVISSPGHTIAVNSGILAQPGTKIDYWAISDLELFDQSIHIAPVRIMIDLTLWIPQRWPADIRERYPQLVEAFSYLPRQCYPVHNWDDLARSMPFGRDLEWRSYTILTALALAILRGAERIFVYGADWSGGRYFIEGVENSRTNLSAHRWRDEQEKFEEIKSAAAVHGIVISREGV